MQTCRHHFHSLVVVQMESYLQGFRNTFGFFKVPCTLLPWSSCTDRTLPLLVECAALAVTLGTSLGHAALGERQFLLPPSSQGCKGLTAMETKANDPQAVSHQFTSSWVVQQIPSICCGRRCLRCSERVREKLAHARPQRSSISTQFVCA